MDELFDIEYWLPFNGGQYHCTVAVGVTQEYVDKVKEKYEEGLERWRTAPSAWSLPFHHTLKIVKHQFMPNDKSFQKSDVHSKKIEEAKKIAREEGKRDALKTARYYITNQAKLKEFEKILNNENL